MSRRWLSTCPTPAASFMASSACRVPMKLAAGVGQVLSQRLLIFDALALRFQTVKLRGRWALLSSLTPSSRLLGSAMQVCETPSQAAGHVSPASLQVHLKST